MITTGDGAAYPPPEVRAAHGTVPPRFGFGRPAGRPDIVPWDIDVGPDGAGLPEGSGSPSDGAAVYLAKCAHCHGLQGEGGLNDRLVTPADGGGGRTIGSYWPYATTLFDYVRRAMPYDSPGSLTDDEVYDVTAWLLLQNGLIEATDPVDQSTLPAIVMPGLSLFLPDDREAYRQVR
ncbi:MAG: cytochrome c [Gemmatimonadetes bacterium]|nr:cytochrome c [Gemmatimonadota bacterium]